MCILTKIKPVCALGAEVATVMLGSKFKLHAYIHVHVAITFF